MPQQNKKLKDYKRLRHLYESGAVFTAFDTETTGLKPDTARIIEIGAVRFSKDGLLSTWEHLFDPDGEPIPPFITSLTHITTQMVRGAGLIQHFLPEFCSLIKDTVLVAHNAGFDLRFLQAELERAKLQPVHNRVIDTLGFSRHAYPALAHHRLDFLADALQLNKGCSHRALDDADTCRQLFIKCMYTDSAFSSGELLPGQSAVRSGTP